MFYYFWAYFLLSFVHPQSWAMVLVALVDLSYMEGLFLSDVTACLANLVRFDDNGKILLLNES